jgi:hypothetical protein
LVLARIGKFLCNLSSSSSASYVQTKNDLFVSSENSTITFFCTTFFSSPGQDEISQAMDKTWDDAKVSKTCEDTGWVAVSLKANRFAIASVHLYLLKLIFPLQ